MADFSTTISAARNLPPGPNKIAYHAYLTVLAHLIPHRGLETDHERLSQDRFFAKLDQEEHVTIAATAVDPTAPGSPEGGRVLYVIFRTTESSKNFRDILESRIERRRGPREVVLLVPSLPFTSYTRKVYEKLRAGSPATRFLAFEHRVVEINLPACTSFEPHRVLAPADVAHALGGRPPSVLPRMFENDPALAWTGGKPGDIIEVQPLSEACGTSISHSLVVAVGK